MTNLTKREYFAAIAMQGLLSQHVKIPENDISGNDYSFEPVYKGGYISTLGDNDYSSLAEDAVAAADSLIYELEKTAADAVK